MTYKPTDRSKYLIIKNTFKKTSLEKRLDRVPIC